jgi:hypothetical protein
VSEFGHTGIITPDICIDMWGAGPFLIEAGGKTFRFEDSDRFGPALVKKNGDPLANPWPGEFSAFWRAHRIWRRQGRRLEGGTHCLWDEPKPEVVRHLGGRNYMHIEAGEQDGVTLVETPEGRIPIRDFMRARKLAALNSHGREDQ